MDKPQKRKCKCIENFGFRPSECTIEIDNANYFYCSYCHHYFTHVYDGPTVYEAQEDEKYMKRILGEDK